jgi:hypothetical protein
MIRTAAVTLTALALAAGAAASSTTSPALRLVSKTPLTVKGLHFKARESVRVTLYAGGRTTRIVRTSAVGSFAASFQDVDLDRCGVGYLVWARGHFGDRASLKIPLPECPPA